MCYLIIIPIVFINLVSFTFLLFRNREYINTGIFDLSILSFQKIDKIISNSDILIYNLNQDNSILNLSYFENKTIMYSTNFFYLYTITFKIKIVKGLNMVIWEKKSKFVQSTITFLFNQSNKITYIMNINVPFILNKNIIEREKNFINEYFNFITKHY
jgi:hypothetical protein